MCTAEAHECVAKVCVCVQPWHVSVQLRYAYVQPWYVCNHGVCSRGVCVCSRGMCETMVCACVQPWCV